jgi:hypothetical protein
MLGSMKCREHHTYDCISVYEKGVIRNWEYTLKPPLSRHEEGSTKNETLGY